MERDERTDRFTAVEDRFAGFNVYDRDGDKIGKVDDLFLDENDNPEYIGVKMGFFGLSSTLVPMDAVRADEGSRALYVQAEKEQVKNGPRFDDDNGITPDFERRVREHYDLSARGEGERAAAAGHVLLGDLAEEELTAKWAGRQGISPAARGSGLSDVSRDHDRYLTEG